jgi:predicted outer membrane repeat protein
VVAATIIDCNGTEAEPHRGFYFHSGEEPNSALAGLTVTGGYGDHGGGIRCDNSSPTIADCVVRDNSALYRGGGIYCYYSDPTIVDCAIRDNIETSIAGGGYGGGGIYCYRSNPQITACTITNNSSNTDGGGMYCSSYSVPNIRNCQFMENAAVRWGGGIYTAGGGPHATACAFNRNTAQYGGGIYSSSAGPDLKSCTFVGNVAAVNGGGLCCTEIGPWWLSNCTFSSNIAESGSGGGIFGNYASVRNSILWDNSDSGGTIESAQISAPTAWVSFSCIQDNDANDANIPFGGADSNNIDDYPMFARDPNDGGDGWGTGGNDDYGDLHLQSDSPCINAGDPFSWIDPCLLDMDGEPRVMGLVMDMGADEYLIPMLIVTKPKGGEVWASGSLHEITWVSDLYYGTVDILFSDDGGSGWQTIGSSTANMGSYAWYLPDVVDSNQCMISVVPSVPDPNVEVIDSGPFTIQHYPSRPPAPPGQVPKWDNFRRTGLSETYGPELGCIKWQFETEGAVSASVSVGPNSTVYVPCEDGNLYALDANGALLWSYDTNSPLISSPAVGYYGMIYVGGENGKLHAIDGKGKLRWTHTTDGFVYSSAAVSAEGNIYACSQDGKLYALGPDGSELWDFETDGFGVIGGAIFASPAIGAGGTVYIAGLYDPNLYALDPNNGSVKWECNFPSEGWPFASPVVGADGTIYQALAYDANLYAIEPNSGTISWSTDLVPHCDFIDDWLSTYGEFPPLELIEQECEDWFGIAPRYWFRHRHASCWSKPALGPEGTIYVSYDDPYLRAVDPNGSIKWVTRLGMMGGFTSTVGTDGLIYAASDDGYLCVVDPNGGELARFESDKWLNFPVILADNRIMVSDSTDNTMLISHTNNKVWAVGGQDCQGQALDVHRPEDLDKNGALNFTDHAWLAINWLECTDIFWYPRDWGVRCDNPLGETYLTGDVNRNLYVDWADVAALVNRWLSED